MTLSQPLRGHAAMLLFSALVAGSFSLGARAANLVSPEVLTVMRFILTALVLWVAALLTGGVNRQVRKAPWRWLLLGGMMAAYFVLMFYGLKTATPVSASAVFTLTPIVAAFFGWLILRQKVTGRIAAALLFGALGALWVIFRGDLSALLRLEIGKGELIYFIGCASHALYAVMVRKTSRGEGALTSSLATMATGAVLLLLWSGRDLVATDLGHLPAIVWITLAYVTLAATAITTVLVQYAAMRLPASKVMAYSYLVPSWVILWELAMTGNPLSPNLIAGVALTCVALLLLLKE